MCLGICYFDLNKTVITHFTQSKAMLPIKTKQQGTSLITWGRRTGEPGNLPLGGWASLDAIQQGKWDYYLPRPVKIAVNKFMEQDIEGRSMWFDITAGHWLQGLLIQEGTEKRVYVVTLTPDVPQTSYYRWPRILCD